MGFAWVVFGGIGLIVLVLFLIGRGSSSASTLEVLGLRSAREIVETREALDVEDLEEMLAAHNARRARRGEPAVSVEEIEARWRAEESAMERERDAARRASGSEPESRPRSRWDGLD